MKFINFIFKNIDKKTLKLSKILFNTKKLIQSGFYLDFFLKKNIELFIRNVLVYSSNFLGEKYIIENLIKKPIEIFNYKLNNLYFNDNYNYSLFFKQVIFIMVTIASIVYLNILL